MSQFFRRHLIVIAGIGLAIVMIVTALVLRQIGSAYGRGIHLSGASGKSEPAVIAKNARVRKIIVKKNNTGECVEVTPDGVVRIFATCDEGLTDTFRSTDTRAVQKLFTFVSEYGSRQKAEGSTEVTVELEDGTIVTVYIPPDAGGSGGGGGGGVLSTISWTTLSMRGMNRQVHQW
jgi:hypothetical protein